MVERIFEAQQSRRKFLQWLVQGGLRTVGVAALNGGASMIQKVKTGGAKNEQEQKSARALEEGGDLEVKYFAKDILNVAVRITSQTAVDEQVAMAVGYFAGDAIGGYLLKDKSKLVNRAIGAAGFVGGKVIDFISTMVVVNQMRDPRFKEYGFDVYIQEQNPLLSPNPSRREVLIHGALQVPLAFLGGFRFPSVGRGYGGASPFIVKNNLEFTQLIMTSMKLGYEVKGLIDSGKDKTFIRDFLSNTNSLTSLAG